MGKFVGHQFPYQKSQKNSAAGMYSFGPSTMEKSESFCDVTPDCRLVTRRYVLGVRGFVWGKEAKTQKLGKFDTP